MKIILCFIVGFFLCPAVWSEDVKPPVPVPSGDESLPTPVDLSSLTPLPPQPTDTPTSIPLTHKVQIPTSSTSSGQPSPPTVSASSPQAPEFSPTSEPKTTALTVSSLAESGMTGAAPSAGALTDYFPVAEGAQKFYEYLQPTIEESARFSVKCVSVKVMPNGTIRIVLETTEGGQSTRDHYSLYDNKVEHKATGDQAFTGDYAFKLPKPGGTASWSVTETNGTVHNSKSSFGQAQVSQKTYPDCVVVTEKVTKDGKLENTVIYYYAKGMGLVSMEVYSPDMKLLQDKSYALQQANEGAAK